MHNEADMACNTVAPINKAQQMDDAINSLADVIFQLERVLEDMTGNHTGKEVKGDVPTPVICLQDLMNGGPGRIMEQREKALDQIHHIREILGL